MYRKTFVIHEHHATRLHFDLRLEMDGVLKSWAVPKGPSLDPADKRLAIMVPDHSLSYGKFEGTLEEGTYGAGEVRIWDDGKYEMKIDPMVQLQKGRIDFEFFGLKVRGAFVLTRSGRDPSNWLLIKRNDHFVDTEWKLETLLPVTKKSAAARR